MCSNEEIEELIESFRQLPDLYRQSILGAVRERKNLYELQIASGQSEKCLSLAYCNSVKSVTQVVC